MNARISIMSFNVWGDFYLSERSKNLQNTLLTINSDIILLQEVSIDNLEIITNTLSSHNYIKDWQNESNILWKDSLFNLIGSGFQTFNHPEYSSRGLFWVRLSLKSQPNYEFLVSTSHLPWVGSTIEVTTGINQRIQCCQLILEFLKNISKSNEPIIFGGDLNDDFHPLRVLRDGDNSISSSSSTTNEENKQSIRLYDVFELLDLPPMITHPVRPSDSHEEMRVSFLLLPAIHSIFLFICLLTHSFILSLISQPSRTIDYILINTSPQITQSQPLLFFRPIAAFVKGIRGSWPPPSDHLPVVTILEIIDNNSIVK